MNELRNIWRDTVESRKNVHAILKKLNVIGPDCTPCWSDQHELECPQINGAAENLIISKYLGKMLDERCAEYNGFYLLDLSKAVNMESHLIGLLQAAIGDIPIRQMSALKANHSALLQYARLQRNPQAGIDVAGVREAISACSIGFRPENIIYSNPNFNCRELMICTALGISNFCFDHPAKLEMIKKVREYDVDPSSLKLLLRMNAPFSKAAVDFDRFGLDIEKNKNLVEQIGQYLLKEKMNLAGVSFHIGVGARSFSAYENVFECTKTLFKHLPASQPLRQILNIGGGFSFNDYGQRFFGTLALQEQVNYIGHFIRQINAESSLGIELWTEIGQGYVGAAGSVFTRVDICEKREVPDQHVRVSTLDISGSFFWGKKAKRIYSTKEQLLVGPAGNWSFPIQRLATIIPEVWGITQDGNAEKLEVKDQDKIPTLIMGRTCDPSDSMNPLIDEDYVRFLMPDLSQQNYSQFALRFCSGAYMDSAGDFNGQTVQTLPRVYLQDNNQQAFPHTGKFSAAEELWEYRERQLSNGILTPSQIQQTKELIANQFIEREQMVSWLIQTGQLGSNREVESLRFLFWEKVAATVDNGLSVVRLKVKRGRPDYEGEVVAAVTAMVLDSSFKQELPLPMSRDWERRITRIVFEVEAMMLRRLYRLNSGLREKIFPTCYIAMSAKVAGEGGSTLALRQKVHDLALGAGMKSVSNIATGEFTTHLSQQHPEVTRVIVAPYKDISFYDRKPFEGIVFKERPGELSCFVRDFRGPSRFEEPLPKDLLMQLRIRDKGFKDPELQNY